MLKHIQIENILFLDIETVPITRTFDELPDRMKGLWELKAKFIGKEGETPKDVFGKAGIYAEFGKIICISVGHVKNIDGERFFREKSFFGDNEKELLQEFGSMLEKFSSKTEKLLCAHNGKEFDFPYIARRMLVNSVAIPRLLDIAGKKPWEVKHLDTMELWKFGDYKHYTSLNLLTAIFDIPTPKDDISGADVASVYYEEKNIDRIVRYCEKDVLAIAQLLLRYKNEELIETNNVVVLD